MENYTIHLTKQCNMCCLYCYEMDKKSIYTWEDLLPTLKNIVNKNKDIGFIEFIGGEPLLRFDLIKRIVKYFKEKKIKIHKYKITTNGTILNKEIIEFLKTNDNVEFYISIDGTKNMNQLRLLKNNYINSYDKVINNFNILKNNIDDNKIIAHIVVHLYNVAFLNKGIIHLSQLGFKNIDVGIIEKTMIIDESFKNEFIRQFKHISRNIKNNKIKAEILQLKYKPYVTEKDYIYDNNKLLYEVISKTNDNFNNYDTINYLKKIIYDNHQCILKGEKI